MLNKFLFMHHEGLQQSPTIGTQQLQGTGFGISTLGGFLILVGLVVAVVISYSIFKKKKK